MASARDRDPNRIVVTGMGAVSALGWGIEPLWSGLRSGGTAIAAFRRFDNRRHRSHIAGQVPGEPPSGFERCPQWSRLSYADRFALYAAIEALGQAGMGPRLEDAAAGVFFGSSTGGMLESEWFFEQLIEGKGSPNRGFLASQQLNAPGDAVARHLRVTGPVQTISSACASGALAIDAAMAALRSGEVEVAIAGGSDSLCQITYAGFNSLRAVDERPCVPFRGDRAGMSIGEGAAVLVLESLPCALARGVVPMAELRGAASSCDANHMTAPHPEGAGAALAVERALGYADLAPAAVDFVNAHGTGTPLNDAAEWAALHRVFGERASQIPVTATKGIVGHLLGSSGAIEAVATILCLQSGEIHPTPGVDGLDPALPIDLVMGTPRPMPSARYAVSTSLAFGGSNAALVVGRWPG